MIQDWFYVLGTLPKKADLVGGKIPASQLPSYVDDIIEGYYHDSKFYSDDQFQHEITGEKGKIYLDLSNNYTYRWSGSQYVQVNVVYTVLPAEEGGTDVSLVTTGEKDIWNKKQDALENQVNIKSINGNDILGSGNLAIRTYQPFPSTWNTSGTTAELAASINSDPAAVEGMAYLGEIRCSDLPGNLVNAEATVCMMTNSIAVITISSSNVAPYHWEYNTHSSGRAWRAYGNNTIPECPNDVDGTYNLKATVSSGVVTYTWVSE